MNRPYQDRDGREISSWPALRSAGESHKLCYEAALRVDDPLDA